MTTEIIIIIIVIIIIIIIIMTTMMIYNNDKTSNNKKIKKIKQNIKGNGHLHLKNESWGKEGEKWRERWMKA